MKNNQHIIVFKSMGFIQRREIKSRRDGILLTVDFNLRNVKTLHATSLQSPAGTILYLPIVPSLRDFASPIQYFYKFFISRASKENKKMLKT